MTDKQYAEFIRRGRQAMRQQQEMARRNGRYFLKREELKTQCDIDGKPDFAYLEITPLGRFNSWRQANWARMAAEANWAGKRAVFAIERKRRRK